MPMFYPFAGVALLTVRLVGSCFVEGFLDGLNHQIGLAGIIVHACPFGVGVDVSLLRRV